MQADQEPHPAFICPITNDLFIDPVIAQDGHTYQRTAITDWLKKNSTSPQTRIKMSIQNLKPNIIVKSMMSEFYKFQQQTKELKNVNYQFFNNFSTQINKISKDKLGINPQKRPQNLNIQTFVCPLNKKIFQEPVLASDGITYQKKAIEKWLLKNNISPVTNKKLENYNLLPNHAPKSIINLFKQEEQQWKNVKETEKNRIFVFAPKVKEILHIEVLSLEKKAVQRLLTNWQDPINLNQQKEIVLIKQAQLNAYSLRDDKYKFQVPYPISNFVGRQDNLILIDKILIEQNIVCLVGPVGIGKTSLATEYIKRSRFPSIIWLHGQNKLMIIQIQTYMKKAHNENLQNKKNPDLLFKKFYKKIGPKALIVVDNVQNTEQIKDFLSKNKSTKIILTSRYKLWKYPTIQLSQFSFDDTLRYLSKKLINKNKKMKSQQVKNLYNLLGGIPLAISQAVAYIKQDKNLSIQKYCELIKKTQNQILAGNIQEQCNYYYTTLILVLHNLKKQNNQIDLVIDVIGYMDPQKLDTNLTLCFLESQNGKGLSKSKSKKIKQIFKLLCNYFIISQNHQTDENIFSIHHLTQSVIRMIHIKNKSFQKKYNLLASWLVENMRYDDKNLNNSQKVTNLISHGLAMTKIKNTDLINSKIQILMLIGQHQFYAKKNYTEAKTYFQYALQVLQRRPHKFDNPDLRVCIFNQLGCINNEIGNFKKQIEFQQKAIQISNQFLGNNSQRTAEVLTNLGHGYGLIGQFQKQKDTLQKALKIKQYHLQFNKDHISLLKTLTHLATAYGHSGDYYKKIQILLRALAISEKYNGQNHPANNVILIDIENTNNQHSTQFSIQTLQQSLKLAERKYGNKHPKYALIKRNLGVALIKKKQYQKALQYLQESLLIYRNNYGQNNSHTIQVLNKVNQLYILMDNQRYKSINSNQKLLNKKIDKKNYLKLQSAYQLSQNHFQKNNSNICQQQRQNLLLIQKKETLKHTNQVLQGNDQNKKVDQIDIKLNYSQIQSLKLTLKYCHYFIFLGILYYNFGKFKKAIYYYQQSLKILQKQRGQNDYSLSLILNLLSDALNQINQFDLSLKYLNRAFTIIIQNFGKNSTITATTFGNLGVVYLKMGQPIQAKQLLQKAYLIMLYLHGSQNQYTNDALFNLKLAEQQINQQQKIIKSQKKDKKFINKQQQKQKQNQKQQQKLPIKIQIVQNQKQKQPQLENRPKEKKSFFMKLKQKCKEIWKFVSQIDLNI